MADVALSPLEGLDLAIAQCGSRAALARRIGMSEQCMYRWFAREAGCSFECATFVAAACDGKVSVFNLRPRLAGILATGLYATGEFID